MYREAEISDFIKLGPLMKSRIISRILLFQECIEVHNAGNIIYEIIIVLETKLFPN